MLTASEEIKIGKIAIVQPEYATVSLYRDEPFFASLICIAVETIPAGAHCQVKHNKLLLKDGTG